MTSHQDGSYRIEPRWREVVLYWEGDRAVIVPAGWGVKPPVPYAPLRSWDESVPSWLRGRREEVVERLRDDSNHVVEETDYAFGANTLAELAPVASAGEAQRIADRYLDSWECLGGHTILDERTREAPVGWVFVYEAPDDEQDHAVVVLRATGEVRIPSREQSLDEYLARLNVVR